MRIILFYLLFFALTTLNAQYVITASASPAPGDIDETIQTYSTGVTQPASGANKLWNYSGVILVSNSTSSSTYTPLSSAPNSSLFTGATISKSTGGDPNVMFKINSSVIELLGSAATTQSSCLIYSNARTMLTLPFTYGSGFSDTYGFSYNGVTLNGTVTTLGSGTGTLVLPGHTLINVLMVTSNREEVYSGSLQSNTQFITNSFYVAGTKFPLFTTETHTSTSLQGMSTGYYNTINKNFALTAGIKETRQDFEFSVYPNPITNQIIHINLNGKENSTVSIKLINTLSQSVQEETFDSLPPGENIVNLQLNKVPPGIYYLQINSNNYKSLKKIIIE